MGRTRIKICGVTDASAALVAADAGADAIGLVFAPGSPRLITPEQAWSIAEALPPFVTTVGLFVDADLDEILAAKDGCPFHLTQMHGSEAEPVVRRCGPDLIKAVRYDAGTIEGELRRWSAIGELDAVLVDGGAGGRGERVDWAHLGEVAGACDHPLMLAGGLTPENVGEAIRAVRPWAVDVSSGVERERGVKDAGLIRAFCAAVREADGGL